MTKNVPVSMMDDAAEMTVFSLTLIASRPICQCFYRRGAKLNTFPCEA